MADSIAWPIEVIPSADSVHMRAHESYYRDGELMPGVFTAKNGGMSVDWGKYASPEDTRLRAKKPAKNAVLSLSVASIRDVDDLDVKT